MKSNLDLLQELVSCRPVSSDIPAVNQAMLLLRDFLQAQGVHCVLEKIGENQVLYASTQPGKVQDVLLNAHVDVVPAEDSQFIPRVENGRIYARGVDDDLGCVVCIARILCQKLGKSSVGAIFSADEEVGGHTTAKMIELGYGARKLAIVMDGPNCNIAIAQKGIQIVELIARGRGGHSSQPWSCDNPIDKLIDAYLQLRQNWPKVTAEDQWQNTMAACICKAGSVGNQIPDEARMTLNFRFLSEADRQNILTLLGQLKGVEIKADRYCQPLISDGKDPAFQIFREAIKRHFPQSDPQLVRMNGATDARHMTSLGVPIAISGIPGGGCHGPQEWLDLQALEKYILVLSDVIDAISPQ